jgi:hypothetical protein
MVHVAVASLANSWQLARRFRKRGDKRTPKFGCSGSNSTVMQRFWLLAAVESIGDLFG